MKIYVCVHVCKKRLRITYCNTDCILRLYSLTTKFYKIKILHDDTVAIVITICTSRASLMMKIIIIIIIIIMLRVFVFVFSERDPKHTWFWFCWKMKLAIAPSTAPSYKTLSLGFSLFWCKKQIVKKTFCDMVGKKCVFVGRKRIFKIWWFRMSTTNCKTNPAT